MIKYLELPGNAFLYPLVIILNKWLRLRLYFSPSFNRLDKKEDITVVVGVKDIDSKSLANCLKSIRGQFYDQSLVEIALVDYDSKEESIPLYKELCIKFQVKYIRVDNRPIWSRSNALNIGIKRAKTKYILTMDADLIFENNYIKEVVKELKRDPYQLICSQMLDLPDIEIDDKSYEKLKSLAKVRFQSLKFHCSVCATLTYFYHRIRGYDERFHTWGCEDRDLFIRFVLYGLRPKSIFSRASYLHQHHEKFRNVNNYPDFKKSLDANMKYHFTLKPIVRNLAQWGE